MLPEPVLHPVTQGALVSLKFYKREFGIRIILKKLNRQLSWGIAYPELAYLGYDCLGRLVRIGDRFDRVAKLFNYNYGIIGE